MKPSRSGTPTVTKGNGIPVPRPALRLLLKAYDCAREVERPARDFAVELHCLEQAGLTTTDLRWLVCKGYAEHGSKVRQPSAKRPSFRRRSGLEFTAKTCVVLTELGVAFARQVCGQQRNGHGGLPRYDAQRRQLWLGDTLVKEFRQPADNQETILLAFQEERWRRRIDDPLPPRSEMDSKERLRATLKNLNLHQQQRRIRFRADGTGRGACWEPCDSC